VVSQTPRARQNFRRILIVPVDAAQRCAYDGLAHDAQAAVREASLHLRRILPLQDPAEAAGAALGVESPSAEAAPGRRSARIAAGVRDAVPRTVATAAEPLPELAPGEQRCHRCGHGEEAHPVRYVCDKYPHPDPLQICGCQSETLEDVCSTCGHKARSHKARHRCRTTGCHCWAFETESGSA
jgi:hypothetical protein